ncbi:hypothetical protein K3495_g2703 [Podosphaera aphanis]|nr:hypothetical protein K3495_g2703 [Podosphaera aphanis]
MKNSMAHHSPELKVPNGFHTLQQLEEIRCTRSGKLGLSVIGLVKRFQPSKPTRGSDYKCSVEIADYSMTSGVKFSMFWPLNHMPKDLSPGDAVIISRVNIDQTWESLALLASKSTILYVISTKDTRNATRASRSTGSWESFSYDYEPNNKMIPVLEEEQMKYAIQLNDRKREILTSSLRENSMPTLSQPRSFKDKFALIRDVKVGNFYDIIGEVFKIWPSASGCVSVYVSDYTANSLLYNYSSNETEGREGDEYAYSIIDSEKSRWRGPSGKLTIQITLWGLDAGFASESINCGHWLYLKNVRMTLGKNNGILEGKLSSDPGKKGLMILEELRTSPEIHSHWKAAKERRRGWMTSYKNREAKKNNQSPEARLGEKRKFNRDGDGDGDSDISMIRNKKQKKKRAKKGNYSKINEERAKELGLNSNVGDSHLDKVIVSIKDILAPSLLRSDPKTIYAPFTNRRYRTIVRVIDYFPNKVEDFIVDSTDEAEFLSNSVYSSEHGIPKTSNWEMRFALLLEDASPSSSLSSSSSNKARIWVFVNNQAAKDLLNLEEDITIDPRENLVLNDIRERLFRLWGNLEEFKNKSLMGNESRRSPNLSPALNSDLTPSPGNQPDPDSDVERLKSGRKMINRRPQTTTPTKEPPRTFESPEDPTLNEVRLSNKPFICCIQQYGVKVHEEDPMKANAGSHHRWQRMFGLFGTKIL